jgi:hypothetical protein
MRRTNEGMRMANEDRWGVDKGMQKQMKGYDKQNKECEE